jgi:hypothetical protein
MRVVFKRLQVSDQAINFLEVGVIRWSCNSVEDSLNQ